MINIGRSGPLDPRSSLNLTAKRQLSNDAPALVQADLGIAIGTGTDVAIELKASERSEEAHAGRQLRPECV